MSKFKFLNWLGGVIDADGYFSISLSKQHSSKNPRICVTPQIGVTSRADKRWYLEFILKNIKMGTIYSRGRSPHPQCAWQTVSAKDGLEVAKQVYPYLFLKKDKCKKFIEVLEYWIKTANPDRKGKLEKKGRSRYSGGRMRTQEQMLRITRVACSINADRQTRRYKNKLTYKQWVPLIKKWYSV